MPPEIAEVEEQEVVQEETPIGAEEQPQDESATETLEAVKEELAEARKEIAKLTQQYKSVTGSSRAALDNQADLKALRRRMDYLTQMIPALATRQDNPEEADANIQKFTQSHQQQEAQEAIRGQADEYYTDLKDEAEDSGLDLGTAAEFAEVREVWNEGFRTFNVREMQRAVRMAKEVRRQAQVKDYETRETEKKKSSGSLRSPAIRSSGGGSNGMNWTQAQKVKNIGEISNEAYEALIAGK